MSPPHRILARRSSARRCPGPCSQPRTASLVRGGRLGARHLQADPDDESPPIAIGVDLHHALPPNTYQLVAYYRRVGLSERGRYSVQRAPYIDPDGVEKSAGESATHGVALSDLTFSGGTVAAEFTFNESAKAVGELILTYNPETREMLTAGIGGWPGMFSVREWVQNSTVNQDESTSAPPAMQWNTIGSNGDRRNIKSSKTYHVRASLRGSNFGRLKPIADNRTKEGSLSKPSPEL